MKISKVVTIKNYEAEDTTMMPVVLVENLEESIGGKCAMKYMICTLHLTNASGDTEGLPDYVIAVNKKFLKLRNKNQLALIALENEKRLQSQYSFETNKGVVSAAKAEVITMYGKFRFNRATGKSEKFEKKALSKVTAGAHRQYKKDLKSIQKLGKVAEGLDDFIDDEDDGVADTPDSFADAALQGAVNVAKEAAKKINAPKQAQQTQKKDNGSVEETPVTPEPVPAN